MENQVENRNGIVLNEAQKPTEDNTVGWIDLFTGLTSLIRWVFQTTQFLYDQLH